MDRFNGILRLYSLLIVLPILFVRRQKIRTAEDEVGRWYDILVILCLALMGFGAVRLLLLPAGSPAALCCRMAECTLFYLGIGVYSVMLHLRVRLPGRGIKPMPFALKVTWFLCFAGIAYWICVTVCRGSLPGILSDEDTYHFIGQLWGNAAFGLSLCVLIRNRRKLGKRHAQLYFMHVILPVAGALIYYLSGGIEAHYVGIALSTLLLYILKNEAHEARVWREMQLSRLAVMESEIRPHFLFNCINSIYALCAEDAVKASGAATYLKKYLEGSFSALDAGGLVPMETELDHIRNYLALEELRFGDKLKVRYELDDTGFMIPFLTVQPLVENAVKHGLRRKCCGGTVAIKSRRVENGAEILVEDDGIGFDASQLVWTEGILSEMSEDSADSAVMKEDAGSSGTGKEHIGLENVRRRLEAELQAELTVKSAPGNGTCARILIPSEALREVPA